MKNRLTLAIASILLILCVIEKEARYKIFNSGNVENMYNVPKVDVNNMLETSNGGDEVAYEEKFLYNPSKLIDLASDSAVTNREVELTSRGLLNSPSGSKLLGY